MGFLLFVARRGPSEGERRAPGAREAALVR
jgi:hypothetical protein